MRTIETDTFSIDIPDIFESVRPIWQSVRAEHEVDDDFVMITAGLSDDAILRKQRGAGLAERFRAWCAQRRGAADLVEDKEVEVAGYMGRVVTARAESGYAFYFAVVPIGDGLQYDFTGDCLVGQEAEYFPLFEQALLSLRVFGDPAAALAVQKQGVANLLKQQSEEDAQPDEEPLPAPPFAIPQDGREYLTIAGHAFDCPQPPECVMAAVSYAGSDLTVELKARAASDAAREQVCNDYQDGEVYLRFALKGVYRAGVPTGRFTFERDRDAAGIAYLWKGGFRYDLDLSGELVLADGWIGFSGWLAGSGQHDRYPVACARRLPLRTLDWTHYRFMSLDELFNAPADLPRHLQLSDPGLAELPQALYGYTALRTLDIIQTDPTQAGRGLKEIPGVLARLRELRQLGMHGMAQVREIPPALGDLRELERLFITGSQAVSVPPEILVLPRLEYCTLSNNQLESLPADITPSLRSLTLSGNRLAGLPDSLAQLPKLEYLDIESNPLTSLPRGLERIAKLKLEMDKKHRLLDYGYRGADGRGAGPFDDALFLACNDAALALQLDEAMADEAWEPYRDGVRSLALRAVALATTEPDDYGRVGNTRFGGLPDLPDGIDYPTYTDYEGQTRGFQFIAQLNCAELAPFQDYLPRSGMLYFFISDQEALRPCVIHHDGGSESLRPVATLDLDDDFIDDDGIYPPWHAKAGPWASVPPFYSDESYYQGRAAALAALEEDFELSESLGKDLAAAAPVEPVHGVNCYVFKQHDTPQIEAADALRGRPEEFMVLLRVSSDRNPGFQFWDAGEIYFVIHKGDLARGDFSNVHCGLESS